MHQEISKQITQYNLSSDFSKKTDADRIELLETIDNKRGFILEFIREKMKNIRKITWKTYVQKTKKDEWVKGKKVHCKNECYNTDIA